MGAEKLGDPGTHSSLRKSFSTQRNDYFTARNLFFFCSFLGIACDAMIVSALLFLTKRTASNGWKPEEGNDLRSLIVGTCLGKPEKRSILQ
jgi:hypothetical protein